MFVNFISVKSSLIEGSNHITEESILVVRRMSKCSAQLRAREELPRALDLLHERVGRSAELAEGLVALPDLREVESKPKTTSTQ